jgi:hypothetical protein
VNTADERDRGEAGSGVSGGVRESEGERGRAAAGCRHAGLSGVAPGDAVQTQLNFDCLKQDLPWLKKIEAK